MHFESTLLLAVLLLPGLSYAQTEPDIETLVVTGSYAPLPITAQTASVSIIDREELLALNKSNLADVLKTVPGLSVEELGGPGGLSAVSIRGGESNFTLVLVDGVPQNDPTNSRGGSFDFSNLDPVGVERIEIVRGPQSAIYGSDGLAGVINVITRRGQQGHRQQLRAEWGENNIRNLQLAASGSLDAINYSLELSQRDAGEQIEGSTRETDSASARLAWQISPRQQLSASYRYLNGDRNSYPEQSGGPQYALIVALDDISYRDESYALGWQIELTDQWRSTLNASRFEHTENYDSPGIFPFNAVPPNSADTDFQRDQLQWLNTLKLNDSYQLNLGVDYRDEQGASAGLLDLGVITLPTSFEMDRSTTGLFADIHAQLSTAFILQGGVRYDDPDGFESETSFKLGTNYKLNQALTFSANWGEAYKLPSFFALGHPLVGNPELKPETVRSWDLGFSWAATQNTKLLATYFFNDYRDLVDFDSEQFLNVNRSQVKSRGTELEIQWQPASTFSLRAQGSYTDLDVEEGTPVLLGRPRWRAGALARWDISGAWNSVLDYQWTGEQYASSLHTGETVIEKLDDYHRVDWNLRFQFNPAIQLELAVDNLLDERYQTAVGFNAVGRTVRLAITASNAF